MTQDTARTKTTYLVLRLVGDGEWRPCTEAEANNGLEAIRSVADVPGDYRAVPVRNITSQAMGNPPPEPPKLVPVDPDQLTFDGTGPADEFVDPPAVVS